MFTREIKDIYRIIGRLELDPIAKQVMIKNYVDTYLNGIYPEDPEILNFMQMDFGFDLDRTRTKRKLDKILDEEEANFKKTEKFIKQMEDADKTITHRDFSSPPWRPGKIYYEEPRRNTLADILKFEKTGKTFFTTDRPHPYQIEDEVSHANYLKSLDDNLKELENELSQTEVLRGLSRASSGKSSGNEVFYTPDETEVAPKTPETEVEKIFKEVFPEEVLIPLEEAPAEKAPPVEAPPVEAPPVEAPPVEAPPVEAPPVEAPVEPTPATPAPPPPPPPPPPPAPPVPPPSLPPGAPKIAPSTVAPPRSINEMQNEILAAQKKMKEKVQEKYGEDGKYQGIDEKIIGKKKNKIGIPIMESVYDIISESLPAALRRTEMDDEREIEEEASAWDDDEDDVVVPTLNTPINEDQYRYENFNDFYSRVAPNYEETLAKMPKTEISKEDLDRILFVREKDYEKEFLRRAGNHLSRERNKTSFTSGDKGVNTRNVNAIEKRFKESVKAFASKSSKKPGLSPKPPTKTGQGLPKFTFDKEKLLNYGIFMPMYKNKNRKRYLFNGGVKLTGKGVEALILDEPTKKLSKNEQNIIGSYYCKNNEKISPCKANVVFGDYRFTSPQDTLEQLNIMLGLLNAGNDSKQNIVDIVKAASVLYKHKIINKKNFLRVMREIKEYII